MPYVDILFGNETVSETKYVCFCILWFQSYLSLFIGIFFLKIYFECVAMSQETSHYYFREISGSDWANMWPFTSASYHISMLTCLAWAVNIIAVKHQHVNVVTVSMLATDISF